jgi:hypothetical protein
MKNENIITYLQINEGFLSVADVYIFNDDTLEVLSSIFYNDSGKPGYFYFSFSCRKLYKDLSAINLKHQTKAK